MKNKEEFKKGESLITFRGEEMKLSEGRSLLNKILDGSKTLELTKSERTGYEEFNAARRRENEKRKARGNNNLCNEISEKDYIAFLLSIPVIINEKYENEEDCRINGHKKESVLSMDSRGRALCYCGECKSMYERGLTQKEWKRWDDIMHTPFTI